MAVREGDLHGVVTHDGGRLSARFRLKHRQRWKSGARGRGGGERFFFAAFVVTGCTRTFISQVGEVIVAGVAVGPSDIDSCAAFYVNFDVGRFFSRIKRGRHVEISCLSALGFTVATIARRNGIAMRAGFWMPKERADTLVEFRADDVLELAGLGMRLGIVNRESVLEE